MLDDHRRKAVATIGDFGHRASLPSASLPSHPVTLTKRKRLIPVLAAAGWLLVALPADVALAQKPGGILKMYDPDSPASMSIHEEGTIVSERPMMGVFNNLVM